MPFLAGEKRLVLALRNRRATRYIPSHLTPSHHHLPSYPRTDAAQNITSGLPGHSRDRRVYAVPLHPQRQLLGHLLRLLTAAKRLRVRQRDRQALLLLWVELQRMPYFARRVRWERWQCFKFAAIV